MSLVTDTRDGPQFYNVTGEIMLNKSVKRHYKLILFKRNMKKIMLNSQQGQEISSCAQHPDHVWGPPNFLPHIYQWLFPQG